MTQAASLASALRQCKKQQAQIDQLSNELEYYKHLSEHLFSEMNAMKCLLAGLHVGDTFDPLLYDAKVDQLTKAKIVEQRRLFLGVDNIEELWSQVKEYLSEGKRGPKATFSRLEQLAVTLIWMRRGFPKAVLSAMCCMSDTRINDIVTDVYLKLQFWVKRMVRLPEIEDWSLSTPQIFRKSYPNTLFFFVDGTILEIFQSNLMVVNRDFWNPKHKIVSITFTILVTPDGRIVYVSQTYPGKHHDRKVWFDSGINQALVKKYWRTMLKLKAQEDAPILAIGGDKGYIGLVIPEQWRLYITKSAAKVADDIESRSWDDVKKPRVNMQDCSVTEKEGLQSTTHHFMIGKVEGKMQQYPGGLAEHRSMVERTFADLKDWQLLHNRYFTTESYKGSVEPVILLVCALTNFIKDTSIQLYLRPHFSDGFFRCWGRIFF
jgi:hypothetical protein